MKDEVYWTMSNGQKINVDDMSSNDMRDALKMFIRHTNNLGIRRATRRSFVTHTTK